MLRTLAANYRLDSIGMQLWSKTSVRKNTNGRAYFQRLHDKPLLYRNIGEQIQRAADIYENEPAFISCHENRTLSFAQAKKAGEDLAIQLSQLGMKPGDHLGIWAPNTTQWYITFMAAALGGYPLICLNYALKAQEMAYQLQKAKVKALVTPDIISKQDYNGILKSLLPNRHKNADFIDDDKFPHLKHVIMQSQTKEDGFIDFDELLGRPVTQEQRRHLNEELVPSIEPEMPCNIQFTSGTTGRPKAALLSHFNHVNMGFICGPNWGIGSGDNASIRICTLVPLFHAFGMGVNMAALHYGGALVSPSPTFNPTAALTAIEKEKCSFICGTPTMYLDMLQMQNKLNKDMSSMQYGVVGGAACTPQVFKSTKEQLGLKYFRIGYGQSECTTCAFLQVGGETPKDSETTIGTLLPHLEAKVIDKQGRIVKYGETGELCIRGFSTMLCYYDDEEKTKETLSSDGWLRTGDDVTLSEEGIGRIMGRQKEMIIRGGENIFPKEIEDFLDSHPDILESQVVGVPDERMGEEVCVYLRLKSPSKTLTLDDIKLFCKDKIAHFKIPRYLRIVEDYPKTNSGKIQKYKLQEMFTKDK